MMVRLGLVFVAFALGTVQAAAQTSRPRFYAATSTAVDVGSRGFVFGGAVPTAGGLFGVRLTDAWSVEVEVDRGFRRTFRASEAISVAYPPTNTPSREDLERYGIRSRWERTNTAGPGVSAHAMWRTRDPGRLNGALFFGVSSRRYDNRVVRTTLSVPAILNLPSTHPEVLPSDSTRHVTGTGYTVGFLVLARLTPSITIAPEARFTMGMITDDPYRIFRLGTRLTWAF